MIQNSFTWEKWFRILFLLLNLNKALNMILFHLSNVFWTERCLYVGLLKHKQSIVFTSSQLVAKSWKKQKGCKGKIYVYSFLSGGHQSIRKTFIKRYNEIWLLDTNLGHPLRTNRKLFKMTDLLRGFYDKFGTCCLKVI